MLQMNQLMRQRWKSVDIERRLETTTLSAALSRLLVAPLLRDSDCCLLEALAAGVRVGIDSFVDKTGYEAFVNSIHVDDYLGGDGLDAGELLAQAVLYSKGLERKLCEASRPFRIVLSLDPALPTSTVRFFQRREGEIWGPADLASYTSEELLFLDVG